MGAADLLSKDSLAIQLASPREPVTQPPWPRKRSDGEAETLTRKAIEVAIAGDGVALRLCLERILPARKSRRVEFHLPTLDTAADLPLAYSAVVAAMSAGELSPDEALIISNVFEGKRKALETVDHEARLAALEKQQTENPK
jgi:hypothetical protein